MRILLLNGPNLNLLGTRQPQVYGPTTLGEVERLAAGRAEAVGAQLESFQSNHEGELIDRIHAGRGSVDGIVFNPGALSHSSYALHDAIEAVEIPTVEVHISNIRAREEWRAHSVIAPATVSQIFGRGVDGYRYAIDHLIHRAQMPFQTLGYGNHSHQVGDLRMPEGSGPHQIAVLYHGGFWREVWARDLMDGLATDLTKSGWATWNVEFRRIPPVGGWRDTVGDAVASLDHVADLAGAYPIDIDRVMTIGHSAGGHLAVVAAAAARRVTPIKAIALAGVLDFEQSLTDDDNNGVRRFLGDRVLEDLDNASPIRHLPVGVPQLIVHGSDDANVPIAGSRAYASAAADAGDDVETEWLDGVGHMELIDPTDDAWAKIRTRL